MEKSRQLKAAAQDEKIYHEKRLRYLGTARVELSSLKTAPVVAGPGLIRPQSKDVKELKRRFRLEAVRRLANSERYVRALISEQELAEAVQRSNIHLEDLRTNDIPPKLAVPVVKPLDVLDGRTRLAAAEDLLGDGEGSWWVVDLYSTESSLELQNHLREEFPNSIKYCDGDILRHILYYKEQGDELEELKWWARLSKGKKTNLERALKIQDIYNLSVKLCHIPGLWPRFLLGPLQRYRILKCRDLFLNYGNKIYSVFFDIAGGDRDIMELMDAGTVEALELKAPQASTEDAAFVNKGMMSGGKLFPSIKDPGVREKIRLNILAIPHLIPTLASFCEDTKYIEGPIMAMKLLVKLEPEETVLQAYRRIHTGVNCKTGKLIREDGPNRRVVVNCAEEDRVEISFCELLLLCARDFLRMANVACRKDEDKHKPIIREPSALVLYRFAARAWQLGFDSPEIRRLQSTDPVAQEFLSCLTHLESEEDDFDEERVRSLVKEMIKLRQAARAQQERIEDAFAGQKPVLTTHDANQRPTQRCGRPFDREQKYDKRYLYLRWVFGTSHSQGQYVTSFFVKRAILTAFLGTPIVLKAATEKSANSVTPIEMTPQYLDIDIAHHDGTSTSLEAIPTASEQAEQTTTLESANTLAMGLANGNGAEEDSYISGMLTTEGGPNFPRVQAGRGTIAFRSKENVHEVDDNEELVFQFARNCLMFGYSLYIEPKHGPKTFLLAEDCYRAVSLLKIRTIFCVPHPKIPEYDRVAGDQSFKLRKVNNSGVARTDPLAQIKQKNQQLRTLHTKSSLVKTNHEKLGLQEEEEEEDEEEEEEL